MTAAALARTAALADIGGAGEFMIFRPEANRARDRAAVAAAYPGHTVPDVLNLWDVLSDLPAHASAESVVARDRPSSEAETTSCPVNGRIRIRTRYARDASTILQRDHYRPDGSLLVIDRRDAKERGLPGGRRVTLFDETGRGVRTWSSIWDLYAYVLDKHLGAQSTVLYVDSKIVARFVATYRRANVATVHVLHSSHLRRGCAPPIAPLKTTRADVMRQLFRFDAVVCSTTEQKADIEALLGPTPNLHVIPPAIALPELTRIERPGGHGLIVASLTEAKRLTDAVSITTHARGLAPASNISLDIYGAGPGEGALRDVIRQNGADAYIRLHDFEPDARARFAAASWTLLTSQYEGFSLALAEAMAAGCLPVAYDVPYGPATLLKRLPDDLVPNGDVSAAAERVSLIASTEPSRLVASRQAARDQIGRFSPDEARRAWSRLESLLLERLPHTEEAMPSLTVLAASIKGGGRITLLLRLDRSTIVTDATVGIASNAPPFEYRTSARVTTRPDGTWRLRARLPRGVERGHSALVAAVSTGVGTIRFTANGLGSWQRLRRGARRLVSWSLRRPRAPSRRSSE